MSAAVAAARSDARPAIPTTVAAVDPRTTRVPSSTPKAAHIQFEDAFPTAQLTKKQHLRGVAIVCSALARLARPDQQKTSTDAFALLNQ